MKLWTVAFVFLCSTLHSQVFTFGPMLGVNFSSINFDQSFDVSGVPYRIKTKDAKIGLVTGAFFRFKVKNFLLMPEVIFVQDRANFTFYNSLDSEVQQIQFNRIDIPVSLGYKFGKSLRLSAGIVGGIILKNDIEGLTSKVKYVSKLSTSDLMWNWQMGLGFDIRKRVTVDFKYEGNFGVYQNNLEFLGENIQFAQRKNTVQITLGIALIPFKKL